MTTPNEPTLVEKPILRFMKGMGYRVIGPDQPPTLRAGEKDGMLRRFDGDGSTRCHFSIEMGSSHTSGDSFDHKRG